MKIYCSKIFDVSPQKLNELCFKIDKDQECKLQKFSNKKDKIRTLIGEILIRSVILKNLNIKNKDIKLSKNKYGKPYLKEYPNFQFNISHSEEYVVCAIDDKPLGIDIEKIKCIDYKNVANSFFTTGEINYIFKKDIRSKLDKFYEIWTLKESYIKCCGQGLSIPLNSFSIEIEDNKNISVLAYKKYKEHTFKIFDIVLGYKLSICSQNKEIPKDIIMVDKDILLNY